jgi:hypothetical protein
VVVIVPKRAVVQREGIAFALCLAVLGTVVVLHLALHMFTPAHAEHHHASGAQQPATEIATERLTADAAAVHDHQPCPHAPSKHDHSRCGAAVGTPMSHARPLLPAGPAIGQMVIRLESATSPPALVRHRLQQIGPPSGADLLVLNSVARI